MSYRLSFRGEPKITDLEQEDGIILGVGKILLCAVRDIPRHSKASRMEAIYVEMIISTGLWGPIFPTGCTLAAAS
jgi:hypothetical protein